MKQREFNMHNYDISWDYMLDEHVEVEHLSLLKRLIRYIKKDVMPLLKAFQTFEVYPIILPNELLGVFCAGTSSRPIIGIDTNGVERLMTVDHIIPKSMGGSHNLSNLQPMCVRCNGKKGSKILAIS